MSEEGRVTDEEISAIRQANLLMPSAAARFCGVDVGTLRRWESEGRISAVKTLGGHRRYHRLDLKGCLMGIRDSADEGEIEALKARIAELEAALSLAKSRGLPIHRHKGATNERDAGPLVDLQGLAQGRR